MLPCQNDVISVQTFGSLYSSIVGLQFIASVLILFRSSLVQSFIATCRSVLQCYLSFRLFSAVVQSHHILSSDCSGLQCCYPEHPWSLLFSSFNAVVHGDHIV